jgi:phosphate transport system ATP-binding protein
MSDQPVKTSQTGMGEPGPTMMATAPGTEVPAEAVGTPVDDSIKVMRLQSVGVRFGENWAVKDVSFDVPENCVVSLIGPSGSGKTTLLRALNRLHDLTPGSTVEGHVYLGDEDIYGERLDATLLRSRVGMVFQRPNPFPTMNIYQNVVSGLRFAGVKRKELLDEAAEASLIAAGLWDSVRFRLRAPATSLSGGEQQRLCIARALAVEPQVLLMDEPTSALDPAATARIEELLSELRERVAIVIVTHNMQQAARVSQRCAFMLMAADRAGELVEFGPTDQLFGNPIDQRTADYIAGRFG